MPPRKTKKNNTKEQGGASPSQERITRARAWLNVEMKSFKQPTIKDSLASQGMTLRGGRTVRAGQGDLREGTYMELIGPDNEKRMKENPQPLPKGKENTLPPPLHPALKPLARDPKNPSKNPPPLCLSDSTEMSTDEYNKVSKQLKQAAKSLNKSDQHPLDVPSTDSEAFPHLAKDRPGEGTDQVRNTDIDSKLKSDSETKGLKSSGIRQEELPQKPLVEPSDTDTTNNTGSSEDDIPSGYMIPTHQQKDLGKGKIPFNLSELKEQQGPKDSIREHAISKEVLPQEQPQLRKLNEWGIKEEQRITFDKGRHIYVYTETLRPVILSNQDQICHLPSLTYYAVSMPKYIYYEVENAQEKPGWNMLYNIDTVIENPVVSMTRVKELYGESLDQFPYITPSRRPAVPESASPYWAESKEQIADEYLVTLGRHQQQFLGNLNPQREKVPKNQGSKDPEQEDREELIQSLIKSNGHLAADVAFLKRSVEEIANQYQEARLRSQENRENLRETITEWHKRLKGKKQVRELRFDDKEKEINDNQYDVDRQVQLAIYLKEGEKQLGELKEHSRQELLEQQKQRAEFQQEWVDIEKAMQASLESEKRELERIRKENLAELE